MARVLPPQPYHYRLHCVYKRGTGDEIASAAQGDLKALMKKLRTEGYAITLIRRKVTEET